MTKPEPARYITTNWKSYNRALKHRGSLRIWRDQDFARHGARTGGNGRPAVFSDAAIQFCLMVKGLFALVLRQTTERGESILSMAGLDWPVPDFSTLSRRKTRRTVQISHRRAPGPLNLRVGRIGIKVPRRWGMACPQAWHTAPPPISQSPSGDG